MHNSMAPEKLLTSVLLIFISLFLYSTPANSAEADGVSTQQFEQAIRGQLNAAFDLQDWSKSLVKETRQGPITVHQLALTITVKLTEPLYLSTGRQQDGLAVIEISKPAGSVIDLQGTAVLALMGSLGDPQLQVILGPSPQGRAGNLLSLFRTGTYVIDTAETTAAVAQVETSSNPSERVDNLPNPLQQLWQIFRDHGEVWGRQINGQYADTPIVLREMKLVDAHTLQGVIEHPYPQYRNEFILSGIAPKFSLTVKRASPVQPGVPVGRYAASADGDSLVVQRGPIFALSAEKSAEIRDDFARQLEPWRFKGEISDYGQMGNLLINLDTLEVVSDAWLNRTVTPISNLPGQFWRVTSNYALTVPPYGAYGAEDVQTLGPRGRAPVSPVAEIKGQTWVAADLSRYVSLHEGDLWVGTLDWQDNSSSEPRNLTNIGLLNDLQPITWCGQDFFFHNPQATQKPILRIDTQTGDITELAETKALNANAQGSPDGRFLLLSDGGRMTYTAAGGESLLHVFDCVNNETFSFDSTIDERHYVGTQKQPRRIVDLRVQDWLGSDIFVGWGSGAQIGWFDLAQRKRMIIADIPDVVAELPFSLIHGGFVRKAIIPGGQFLDVTLLGYLQQNPPPGTRRVEKRFRIDRINGSAIRLPALLKNPPTWVDENRYVYARRTGSFSEIGTWLYDVRTGKTVRLTPFFPNGQVHAENRTFTTRAQTLWSTPLYESNPDYFVLAEKNRIVFAATRGTLKELLSVSLAGGELIRRSAPDGQKHGGLGELRQIHPFPINLPFTERLEATGSVSSNSQMTGTINPSGSSIDKANSSTAGSAPVMSDAEKEAEEVKAMCYAQAKFRTNFECECFAGKFLAKRLEMGPDLQQTVILGTLTTRAAVCLNLPEMRKTEYASCVQGSRFPANGIERETYCQCYADKTTSGFSSFAGKTLSGAKKNTFRRIAVAHCSQPSSYQ